MAPKPKKRTCIDCGISGTPDAFVQRRNLCLDCQAQRQRRSRDKRPKLVLSAGKTQKKRVVVDPFESREALSAYLKESLQESLGALDMLIDTNNDRLEAAKKNGDAKAMHEAAKSLESCLQKKADINANLMHRLQAMEELRANEEKAKPVTFLMMGTPPLAKVLPLKYELDSVRLERCLPPLPRDLYDKNGDLIIGDRVLPAKSFVVRVVCTRIPDHDNVMEGRTVPRKENLGFFTDHDGLFVAEKS